MGHHPAPGLVGSASCAPHTAKRVPWGQGNGPSRPLVCVTRAPSDPVKTGVPHGSELTWEISSCVSPSLTLPGRGEGPPSAICPLLVLTSDLHHGVWSFGDPVGLGSGVQAGDGESWKRLKDHPSPWPGQGHLPLEQLFPGTRVDPPCWAPLCPCGAEEHRRALGGTVPSGWQPQSS